MESDRGTGRTTKMLRELGEGRSIVVVHNRPMKDHVLHIVRRLNAEDGVGRNIVAIAISRLGDETRLYGLTCPLVVDHSFWEMSRPDIATAVRHVVERHNARNA